MGRRALAVAALLWAASAAEAQTVNYSTATFQWSTPTTGGPVESYRVKCGTAPGARTIIKTVPVPYAPVPVRDVLPSSGTFYCAVTAVNSYGESGESNEIGPLSFGAAPGGPGNFRVVTP